MVHVGDVLDMRTDDLWFKEKSIAQNYLFGCCTTWWARPVFSSWLHNGESCSGHMWSWNSVVLSSSASGLHHPVKGRPARMKVSWFE